MNRPRALHAALGLLAFAATANAAPAPGPARELRYSVLMMGKLAGAQVTRITPAGSGELREIAFEFNDRGRGPDTKERIELAPDGSITRLEIAGNDYMKVPVVERFARTATGGASWKNPSEQGEAAAAGAATYLSLYGTPEEGAVLARALLLAPDRSLPLLPAGAARIERIGEIEIRGDAGTGAVPGAPAPRPRSVRLTHYAIHGLGFTPASIWLDADREYFAAPDSWLSIIREGWESSLPELQKAQDAETAKRSAALAQRLLQRPAALAVRHARLFDPETGTVRPDTTIVVAGNRVVAVGPDASTPIPAGAQIHDATGFTVLPGLWDMHAHVSELDGLLNLAAGVTSVRDLANDIDVVGALKRRWDSGEAIGPRLVLAGFIDGPGPYAGPTKVLVDNEADARTWVNRYADLGYAQIKLYSSLKPELVAPIVEEAHRRGLRVSGHIPNGMTAEECVRLGFDELQHVNFLFLNFWKAEVPETRTPARFHAIGERAAGLDLQSAPVRAFVRLLAERGVEVDPTLATFETLFLSRPGEAAPGYAKIAERLPPQVRRSTLAGGLAAPAGLEQRYRDGYQALVKMVGELYRAGVPLVAGTDDLAGFALHRELELYAEAGLPPAAILEIATLGAARVAKRDSELGSVEVGKLADFVVVAGDPLARISDVRNTQLVVKDGWPLRPQDLYREIGIRP
jgi:imidazolonepropionase-like amidohydrolase